MSDRRDSRHRLAACRTPYENSVGLAHFTDLLIARFKSDARHKFQDRLGTFEFLPGEFDYFLTQQGVSSQDVTSGVRDIETKTQLEAAMDERRTGEQGYRCHITELRSTNPQRPGRPIQPLGHTVRSRIPGQRAWVRQTRS